MALLVTVGALVVFAGCEIDLEVGAVVDEDGSGRLGVTVLMGETVRGALTERGFVSDDPAELRRRYAEGGLDALYTSDAPDPLEILEETVPEGWEHTRLAEGRIRGLRLTAPFESLGQIDSLLEPFGDWGDELADHEDASDFGVGALARGFSVTREGSMFHVEGEPSAEAYEGATGGPNNLDATLSISVELPGGIREHDADERDASTLTWVVPPGERRTISATSDLTYHPRDVPVMPIAVGASAVGIAGLFGWRVVRDRRAVRSASPVG